MKVRGWAPAGSEEGDCETIASQLYLSTPFHLLRTHYLGIHASFYIIFQQ